MLNYSHFFMYLTAMTHVIVTKTTMPFLRLSSNMITVPLDFLVQ